MPSDRPQVSSQKIKLGLGYTSRAHMTRHCYKLSAMIYSWFACKNKGTNNGSRSRYSLLSSHQDPSGHSTLAQVLVTRPDHTKPTTHNHCPGMPENNQTMCAKKQSSPFISTTCMHVVHVLCFYTPKKGVRRLCLASKCTLPAQGNQWQVVVAVTTLRPLVIAASRM